MTYKVDNQSRWYVQKFLNPNEVFILPGEINKCTSHGVCLSALLSLYNISYQRHNTLEVIIKDRKTIGPTNVFFESKSNGAIKGLIVEKLRDNFVNIQLHHTEPHATNVVQKMIRIALRNYDFVAELPSSFTKRQMYFNPLF